MSFRRGWVGLGWSYVGLGSLIRVVCVGVGSSAVVVEGLAMLKASGRVFFSHFFFIGGYVLRLLKS